MSIKKTPADFRVEEILKPEFFAQVSGEALAHALYALEKEALATPEAVGQIARQLKLPSGSIAYAGLKDKHAHTNQHVTLKIASPEAAPGQAQGNGWTLKRMGFVPRPIAAADILRNRFVLTLRDLSDEACTDMDAAVELLKIPGESGRAEVRVINYFGEQRFGSARHHQGFLAKHLIRGDFEGALRLAIATEARKDRREQKVFKRTLSGNWGRWREVLPKLRRCPERRAIERLANSGGDFRAAFCALPYLLQQLSVYAYQSYLWNECARRLVAGVCAPKGPVLEFESDYGLLLFPSAEATPPETAALELPLLARKTVLAEPWKEAAEATLAEEQIALADLQIPGVRRPFFGEEPRTLFFTTTGFELGAPEADETAAGPNRKKRVVSFALPAGSYATILLRALGQ